MNEVKIRILKPLPKKKVLISACLLGINCKYNGGNNRNKLLIKLVENGYIIPVPVCPEQLGGLSTPRPQAEIQNYDRVFDQMKVKNIDELFVEKYFYKGSDETVKMAAICDVSNCIMKEGSPSCGVDFIYDGTFSNKKIEGSGITSLALKKNGFHTISSDRFILNPGRVAGLFDEIPDTDNVDMHIEKKGGFVIE